jgi:hypothetical protein
MLHELRRTSHLPSPLLSQAGVRYSLAPLEPPLRTPSGGHEAHRRVHRCFTNRFSISHVVLLALNEGFDVGWWDQTYLAALELSPAAGFQRNDASWKLAKECAEPASVTISCAAPLGLRHQLREPETHSSPDRVRL